MQVVQSWLEENVSDAVFSSGCHVQRHTGDVNFHYPDQVLSNFPTATNKQPLQIPPLFIRISPPDLTWTCDSWLN